MKWVTWTLRPLSLQGLAVVQPDRIGGHTVLQVAKLRTDAPPSALLTGRYGAASTNLAGCSRKRFTHLLRHQ